MPGASHATSARPVTAATTIATCGDDELGERAGGREPEALQRDQAGRVDAEDAAQQVLRRDLEDERVLGEHPRAAQARDDEQRQRECEAGLAGEREQRDERRGGQERHRAQAPGRRHEPDRDQLACDRAGRDGCEPPARDARREAEMRDVGGGERLRRDRARRHEPAQQQHAPYAAVGEHRPHARERVAQQVGARAPVALAAHRGTRLRREAHDGGRPHEAQAVERERPARRGEHDQEPAGRIADDLRRLRDDAEERAPGDVGLGGQDDDRERVADAGGHRRDQSEHEEQREQHGNGDGRERHQADDHGREQVAADHQPARGHAIDESREQGAAEEVGHERERERETREERRGGALEDEHGERDRRHDVAEHRDRVGAEERPELADREGVEVPAAAGSPGAAAPCVTVRRRRRTACGGTRRSRRRT